MAIQLIPFSKTTKKEKPREKIMQYGIESLNDAELLSAILGTGYKGMGVEELSKYLLSQFGTKGLFQFQSLQEIQNYTGLPFVKSCTLLAIGEYIRRITQRDNAQIKSSEQLYEYIKNDLQNCAFEQLRIVCMDAQRRVLYSGLIAQGGSNTLTVTLSDIFYHPIRLSAKKFYLAHNHPQGNEKPSKEDIAFTLQVKEESKKFGLSLDDHIIIAEKGFYSFSLKGIL